MAAAPRPQPEKACSGYTPGSQGVGQAIGEPRKTRRAATRSRLTTPLDNNYGKLATNTGVEDSCLRPNRQGGTAGAGGESLVIEETRRTTVEESTGHRRTVEAQRNTDQRWPCEGKGGKAEVKSEVEKILEEQKAVESPSSQSARVIAYDSAPASVEAPLGDNPEDNRGATERRGGR